jgi:hypothetical protein
VSKYTGVLVGLFVGCGHGDAPPTPNVVAPVTSAAPGSSAPAVVAPVTCEGLTGLSIPHVTITEARAFPASAASGDAPALPASCRVHGVSRPTADSDIRFEVVIPEGSAWNGRYLQLGNGGFAGAINEKSGGPTTILPLVAVGYATAGTDDGHQSAGPAAALDASWRSDIPRRSSTSATVP